MLQHRPHQQIHVTLWQSARSLTETQRMLARLTERTHRTSGGDTSRYHVIQLCDCSLHVQWPVNIVYGWKVESSWLLLLYGQLHWLVFVGMAINFVIVVIRAIQILLIGTWRIKSVTVDIYIQHDTEVVYEMQVGRRNWSLLYRHV